MAWLEVLIILAASRTVCLASDADTYKRTVHHDPWSEWTACSKSCGGGGYKTRTQMCHRLSGPSYVCNTQKEPCQTLHCPITVSHWSEWSSCSVTCGNGESVRQWNCSTHVPLIGKRSTCIPHSERQTCSPGSCPIDGHWGRWSEWSMCPLTCGGYSQSRHRECNNPSPSNGGRQCDGSNMENRLCPLSDCHVDGHWSGWSDFSMCSVSCGFGTQMRSRSCSNPAPRNGGFNCVGSSMESIVCTLHACLPDGHWSQWSSCSVTCGNGESFRHWICSTQIPLIGKRSTCTPHLERQTCSPGECPIDGNWSGWSHFSKCTVSCGLGTQMRSRSCSNPSPINGGLDCVGSSMEATICSFPACVPEPRVCDKIRLLSSIFHNNSISQNGDTSCTDPSYHSSRALIQELCNAPSTSLHFGSQVIDVCNQIPTFSPVVRKDDIMGHTEYGILIECHGNQLKVASQDCNHYVNVVHLDGTESDKYYVVNW